MRRFIRALLALCLAPGLVVATPVAAGPGGPANAPLRELATADDGRGWEGVGRLNLGRYGFCTGALIEPQLVLTAAHCLHDPASGARFAPEEIKFLAGWRNGRAVAYRGVRRAVTHPAYVYGQPGAVSVAHDIALLELDQPIRLPSIRPFEIDFEARRGDRVGVVSYARQRAEAPSLQELCHVLGRQAGGALVLSCTVDFGASGAPIFSMRHGTARIVSVVSAKAEMDGEAVALGTGLREQLSVLRRKLAAGDMRFHRVEGAGNPAPPGSRAEGAASTGARFIRP